MTRLPYNSHQAHFAKYEDKKPTKYSNVKIEYDGLKFDSKLEARRYLALKLLKQAGDIRWFETQPSFRITRVQRYIPDFIVCGKDGTIWCEDAKGVQTKEFKIKAQLFRERYPDIELRLIGKDDVV
jgi:hypothetical protein